MGERVKRIAIATLFGVGAGVICATLLFKFGIMKFSVVTLLFVLLNRAVMGFAIGISSLRVHWAWNGAVMGWVVGSIFSYFLFISMGAGMMPVVNFLVNGLFGLAIEFMTTVVCKQRAFAATPVSCAC
jgi:hypothetical protein